MVYEIQLQDSAGEEVYRARQDKFIKNIRRFNCSLQKSSTLQAPVRGIQENLRVKILQKPF